MIGITNNYMVAGPGRWRFESSQLGTGYMDRPFSISTTGPIFTRIGQNLPRSIIYVKDTNLRHDKT
jgi:hypothetical protein